MTRKCSNWLKMLFAAYCIVMLWLLFGQRIGQGSGGTYWERLLAHLSLEPLDTIRRYLWVLKNSSDEALLRHAVVNLAGNVIMFIPLGCLAPTVWPKTGKFRWHFLFMLLTILAIEILQLFTLLGSCDVDDLILNLAGTTIGYFLWKIIKRKRK